MSADPLIGDIEMVAYNFVPRDYYACAGGLVTIASDSTLYSLLGTMYGGDGRTTFALPDFRGRSAVGDGRGLGIESSVELVLGHRFGNSYNYLSVAQLPSHTHIATAQADAQTAVAGFAGTLTVNAKDGLGDTDNAKGAYWATGELVNGLAKTPITKAYSTTSDVQMATDAVKISGSFHDAQTAVQVKVDVGSTGGSAPILNYQPSTVIKFVIANAGTYPSRS
ncbi:hypothetical protein HG263_17665 [Pseudoalteromonas sp. JBTF-M23]|uniref:Phage tail collar domain-containing protein n=1 Tax=Pseudoalteromonas caenipelagi TaxID=2726988 RepID=A0A849VG01_9GAMM|nr:tail fiber protein [Pseudoalteromonas caenipelagi]NOU52352.1 hypothetical protein [Pseudoalteromonas caenipelagi]